MSDVLRASAGGGIGAISRDAVNVRGALKEGVARLEAARVPSHALAAELLLMHALGRDRAWLYSHPEVPLDHAAAENYFALIARRAAGEPTQYLTGKQEFWGLEFEVTPAVLIPRPETEHVVEVVLERMRAKDSASGVAAGHAAPLRIADVGTGSGCIAVALARELPGAEIFATDISAAALEVARRNAARHGVSARIHFLESNLLDGLLFSRLVTRHSPLPFDLLVSNPPYVSREDAAALPREVREHEPEAALFGLPAAAGGPSGIEIYAQLISQAARALRPGGSLVLELGYNSSEHVTGMFHVKHSEYRWHNVCLTRDLAGIPRVLAAERA